MDMRQLQQLVRDGEADWKQHGEVKATYWEGLVLFNYTAKATYEGRWNWFERNARGLILDALTGEIVARPIEKFWGWLQGGRRGSGSIREITDKLDGSMGTLFQHRGSWRVATRGSFTSKQAIKATKMLPRYDMTAWLEGYTPIVEIVYPENRIVVDYGRAEKLVLIAAKHKEDGAELWMYDGKPSLYSLAQGCGFELPRYFSSSIDRLLELSGEIDGTQQEGWVIRFRNGERFKIKGDRYLELHRIVTQASFRHVLRAVESGGYDSWIGGVPDEFLRQVREWREEIRQKIRIAKVEVEANFAQSPKGTRKDFALWVKENCPELSVLMFARLDGKDYAPTIYREMGKEKRGEGARFTRQGGPRMVIEKKPQAQKP